MIFSKLLWCWFRVVGAALITGGAKRLGRLISVLLASLGYTVIIHYNTSSEAAFQLQQLLRSFYGVDSFLVQADLTNFDSLEKIMDQVYELAPNCSVLINNASVFERKPFARVDLTDFMVNHAIHVRAPFFLSQYFSSRAPKNSSIINIIDTDIKKKSSSYFSYLLSKKSLADLTVMLAKELAPHINVNAICPSCIAEDALAMMDVSIIDCLETASIRAKIVELLQNCGTTGELFFT